MELEEKKAIEFIKKKFSEIDYLKLSRDEIDKKVEDYTTVIKEYVEDDNLAEELIEDYKVLGNVGFEGYCSRFFPKYDSKSLQATIEVLQEISRQNEINNIIKDKKALALQCESLSDDDNSYNASLFTDALKILRCNQLIRTNTTSLKINFDDWFTDESRYDIRDCDVLEYLIPLLIPFVKTSKDKSAHDFFDKIDSILSYFTATMLSHNPSAETEKSIFELIETQEVFTIVNPDKEEETIDVVAEKIFINTVGIKRVLLFDESDSSKEYDIYLRDLKIV
jgi:hypothetical protein